MAYPVDRHAVVLALDRIKMRGDETWYDYYHKALDAIAKLPPVDAVPVEAYKQVRWERDIAMQQLYALGYGLGEKVVPVVRCNDCNEY